MPYGVIAELLEYPKREAFIHISKVSSSWVKNIRSFLSEGQIKVGKVKNIDPSKEAVDVSLRDVSKQQEKKKLGEWKSEKKADKLFEKICKEMKEDFNKSYDSIAVKLIEEFGSLFTAFESVSSYGEKALEGVKIPAKWKKAILKTAKESIKPHQVSIHGLIHLASFNPEGVEEIKKILTKANKTKGVLIEYVSAPKYRIRAEAVDYPTAEKELKKALEKIEKEVKKIKGEFKFEREKN